MKHFLREVAEDLHRRFGDELGKTAIIFNNKRPIVYLKKYLGEVYGKPFWSPSFFTVQTFFARSTEKIIADFHTRFFLLLDVYNGILREDGVQELAEDDFLSMSEIILSDFDQIDYEIGNPDAILGYLKDVAEIESRFDYLSDEQKVFLRKFWASLSTNATSSMQQRFIELWRRLPRLYGKFTKKMDEDGLTSLAYAYRQLAEGACGDAFIENYSKLIFIGFNALSRSEAVFFKKCQDKDKAIFYFDGDRYYTEAKHQEAGKFLRHNEEKWGLVNALGDFPALLMINKSVHIYPVLGFTAQAKVLDKLLDSTASSTAIILADEKLLVPVLQSIHSEDINITMGFPLKQSLVFSFVNQWLALQRTFQQSDILTFFEHPFMQPGNNERVEQTWSEALYLKKHRTGYALLETLIEIIHTVLAQQSKDKALYIVDSALLLRILEVLNQLTEAIVVCKRETVSIDVMVSFVQKLLPGISAPMEGDPLEGVQIMGMLESRCLDFEHVVILGANEGNLPSLNVSPTFIPDSIRRTFDLPVRENQDALSAYLFYRLWQRCGAISVVYNANVGQDAGEASRFLQQLAFESRLPFTYYVQDQKINPSSITKPVVIEKTPKIMAILHEYLDSNHKRSFSASALNLYLECPLQFFLRYIAGIKPQKELLGCTHPITIGRVVHLIMEVLYKEYEQSQRVIQKEDIDRMLKSDLYTVCQSVLVEELLRTGQPSERKSALQIAIHIIEENIRLILEYDKHYTAPFHILELENHTNYKMRMPFKTEGGVYHANLSTIIDRVDVAGGKTRIVDYKTGGDALNFKLDELAKSNLKHTSKAGFQALFYTMIYESVSKTQGVEPHLYILRKMQDEGTLIFADDALKDPGTAQEKLEAAKGLFEERLEALLSEIFDPNIPFRHNDASETCMHRDYALLCHPAGMQHVQEEDSD